MSLRIELLGRFLLTLDDVSISEGTRARVQDLLAWLILHRAASSPRRVVAATLWPDVRDEQALKNLRTLLTRLRDEYPFLAPRLIVENETLSLRLDSSCTVDLLLFEQARAAALTALGSGDVSSALAAFAKASAHYGGDLLPGHNDEWIRPERERLHRAWIDTLDQRARLLSNSGAHIQAQEVARQLLHADPLHESAYSSLMRSQLALGDRAGALRTYHVCAALLRDELGVDPGAETQATYESVLFDAAFAARPTQVTTVHATSPSETRTGSLRGLVASAPMVGRRATMAWARERWRAAGAGAPQVLLLAGEAGIGKTRVVQEFAGWIDREGKGEIAIARAYSASAAAYAPIAAWLRSPAGNRRLQGASALTRAETARLVPESGASEQVEPLDETWRRHRFHQALTAALLGEGDAASTPFLLVLEDAQWADAETLAWLPQLLEAAQGKPLCLLLTLRLEESPENVPLERLLVDLRRTRNLHERELRRLNLEETTQLVEMLAADQSDLSPAKPFAANLFRETEGIPLFVVETVRAGFGEATIGTTDQTAAAHALHLSPVILATLRSRIDQVSQPARELAECAAVLGREFRYAELALTSQGDEETLVRALDELWRKRIVREQGADAYDFSHDKLRAVAYSGLSNARRRMLHRRAAEAVLATRGEEQGVHAEIAAHYEQAGELEAALRHYIVAARHAKSISAAHEAIGLYEKVLQEQFAHLHDARERVAWLLQLGELYAHDNRGNEAEATYLAAERGALALEDALLVARARLGIAATLHFMARLDDARLLLDEVRATFEAHNSLDDLIVLHDVAQRRFTDMGELELTIEHSIKGIEVAEAVGNTTALITALFNLGAVLSDRGRFAESLECVDRALPLAEDTGNRGQIALCHYLLAVNELSFHDSVVKFLDAARELSAVGERQAYHTSTNVIAYAHAVRGEYLLACAGHLHTILYNQQMGYSLNMAGYLVWAACSLRLGGWEELAERVFRAVIRVSSKANVTRYAYWSESYLAQMLVDSGRIDEAEETLARARTHGERDASILWNGLDMESTGLLTEARIAAARGAYDQTLFERAISAAASNGDLITEAHCAWWQWQATDDPLLRDKAIAAMQRAYAATGDASLRERLEELTGIEVEAPLPLPDTSFLIPRGLTESEMIEQFDFVLNHLT